MRIVLTGDTQTPRSSSREGACRGSTDGGDGVNLKRGVRSQVRKALPSHLAQAARAAVDEDALLVDWVNRGPVRENWGDAIAPLLAGKLSGRRVINQRDILNPRRRAVYTTIGSMLGSVLAHDVTAWGSGFVASGLSMHVHPRQVCAVRGPLTRARLLETGIPCPEVYGDPALLCPMFYRPPRTLRYQLGVIPHFKETSMPAAQRLALEPGVRVIDIRAGIETVADQINQCERIASSSLHGLVAGDGYGIPSIWIRMSDRPGGDGFKFRDYLASVGRTDEAPLLVTAETPVNQILDRFGDYRVELDLDLFLSTCPFLDRTAVARSCAIASATKGDVT